MRDWPGILSRLVVVAVAAILLGGGLAAPAEAKQRPAAANANAFVTFCFESNGDVFVLVDDDGEVIRAICTLPGIGHYYCRFEGVSRDCEVLGRLQGPGNDHAAPTPEDFIALKAEAENPAQERGSTVAPAAGTEDDARAVQAKQTKKAAKKAKHGKGKAKHGKGRGGR